MAQAIGGQRIEIRSCMVEWTDKRVPYRHIEVIVDDQLVFAADVVGQADGNPPHVTYSSGFDRNGR